MKKLFVLLCAFSITGCFGPSEEQKQIAQTACEEFVMEKLGSSWRDETYVFETYVKKGKIVVEVGLRDKESYRRDNDSYSVRLCVFDEKEGTIMLPGLFNMGEWSK